MNQKDFEAIEEYDVIEFQRDTDAEWETGSVLKDSDRVLLVGGIDGKIGFWHPVTAKDVNRIVKPFADGSLDRQAIKTAVKVVMSALEKVWNLLG